MAIYDASADKGENAEEKAENGEYSGAVKSGLTICQGCGQVCTPEKSGLVHTGVENNAKMCYNERNDKSEFGE